MVNHIIRKGSGWFTGAATVTLTEHFPVIVLASAPALPFIAASLHGVAKKLDYMLTSYQMLAQRSKKIKLGIFDPEVFDLRYGFNNRDTEFKIRVGEILDELLKDADGRALVAVAIKKGFIIKKMEEDPSETNHNLYGNTDDLTRTINIRWTDQKYYQDLPNTLIHELYHAVTPVYMKGPQATAIQGLEEATAFSLPAYIGYKLLQEGHSKLWEALSINRKSEFQFSDTEKFEMAYQDEQDLDGALKKTIFDWLRSGHRSLYINKQNTSGRSPLQNALQYLGVVSTYSFNLVSGLDRSSLSQTLTRWAGRDYLSGFNPDLVTAAHAEHDFQAAEVRGLKEIALKHPAVFTDLLGIELLQQPKRGIAFLSSSLSNIHAVSTDGGEEWLAISHERAPESPLPKTAQEYKSLDALWSAIDELPDPLEYPERYIELKARPIAEPLPL